MTLVGTLPFVGRSHELDAIRRLIERVRGGGSAIALVEGEAGIGKSRLVEEALRVEPATVQIFAATCEEFERGRAFAPLITAFGCVPGSADPRRSAIAHLIADIVPAQDLTSRHFGVIDELTGLIEDIAVRGPVVLVVDDLQWADEGTITALRSFGKRLTHVGVAILGATRPVPVSLDLQRLINEWRDRGALVLSLDALGEEHVERLVTSAFDAEPDEALLRYIGGASGNPLFIGELVGALARENSVSVVEGRATLPAGSRPPDLGLVILRRLTFLSDEALRVLRFGSLFGSSFLPSELATVMATPLPAMVASIEECVSSRLLRPDGDRLRFRHDLIREVLYHDIPEGVRAGLHGEAARALAAAHAPSAHVARHYAVGARPGDVEAVQAMRRAALEDEPSPAARIGLLERAQALVRKSDPLWTDLEADLVETMVWGGRPDEGEARARSMMARTAGSPHAPRMRAAAAHGLRLGGRWVELANLIDGWLTDPRIGQRERIELLATSAYARGSSVAFDARDAEQIGKQALQEAEAIGEEELILHALVGLLPAMGRIGGPGGRDLAERAVAIAEAHAEVSFLRDQAHWHLGLQLLEDPDEAERAFRAGLWLAEERRRVADVPLFLDGLAHVHYYREEWDEAMTEAEAAIAAAEEVGTLLYVTGSHAIRAHILIHRGDLSAAERHIAAEEQLAKRLGPQLEAVHLAHRAMTHEVRGDLPAALESRWAAFRLESQHSEDTNWWRCLFFALRTDDEDKAMAIADWLEARTLRVGTDEAGAEARLARGMVELDPEVVAANLAAVGGFGAMRHERAALACAHVGLRDEALARYQACAAIYERVGAHAWLDHVARLLRSLEVPVPRRRRRARAAIGWESLTDAERRVADLAAEGLTNPQIGERLFISRRTVQTHLAHVFDKLGIASRVELAAEVGRRAGS
jgi:DNA-binding CsgD family transcriptional regulator